MASRRIRNANETISAELADILAAENERYS